MPQYRLLSSDVKILRIRIIGQPERVLVLTGASVISYNFVNSGTRLHGTLGQGGWGSVSESMILVAVEGHTESIDGGIPGGNKTFVLAETIVDPDYA
jgi:hypothetical protein